MLKKAAVFALTVLFIVAPASVLKAQSNIEKSGDINAEVHYLSQQALSTVADSVVSKILSKSPAMRSLIICGSIECRDLIQARLAFEVYERESADLLAEYNTLKEPLGELVAKLETIPERDILQSYSAPVLSESATVVDRVSGLTQTIGSIEGLVTQSGSALTSAFALISLLRNTNVKIESNSSPVDDSLLTTAIVARIKSDASTSGVKVYLPAYAQMANVAVADSRVFMNYRALLAQLRMAKESDAVISIHDGLRVQRDDARTIEKLRTLNQKTTAFINSLSSAPVETVEGDTASEVALKPDFEILEGLIIGEKFSQMLSEQGMILRVGVINLIGTQITKSNLIMGKRIRFSGSATVQYVLTDNTGDLIYADTEVFHTGFKKMSEIREQ